MYKNKKNSYVATSLFFAPIIYIGVLLAAALEENDNLLKAIIWISSNYTAIRFCESTVKTVFICLLIYGFIILYLVSNAKKYRHGEEHGSTDWGNVSQINSKYADKKDKFNNIILTQNVSIGLDIYRHERNLNTVVVGGSGSYKTKGIVQPNILQGNTSMVIIDPKGESLEDNGFFLKQAGYEIRVINLKDLEKSDCYNPFMYAKNDDDIQKIATILMKATTPKDSKSSDPYWDQQAELLLKALMFFLFHEAPPEEQNFPFLMDLLREAVVIDGKEDEKSVVDELFDRLEYRNPDHIALKFYKDYRNVPAKTLNTIQSVLKGRLEKFNLESLRKITSTDDLELPLMGQRKTALFCVIPDDDTSYNFLISILYMQLFQQLERYADSLPSRRLPVHVSCKMDEFHNVTLPADFEHTVSVARSRGFSFTILLQNISQIKADFEKEWESIIGNCDTFIYLGGNETSSHEYVSKRLGKQTIDVISTGKTSGRNGSYSTNYQKIGRDLMTPDEVARLKNKYAILFIRGENPIIDLKYNVWNHPNVKYSALGAKDPVKKWLAKTFPNIHLFDKWRKGESYEHIGNINIENPVEVYIPDSPEQIPDSQILDLDKIMADIDRVTQEMKNKNYI